MSLQLAIPLSGLSNISKTTSNENVFRWTTATEQNNQSRIISSKPNDDFKNVKKILRRGQSYGNLSDICYSGNSYTGSLALLRALNHNTDRSETCSPTESESSGVSTSSDLSSQVSSKDFTNLKLRFNNSDSRPIIHNKRNILDLASNIIPYNQFCNSTVLPEPPTHNRFGHHAEKDSPVSKVLLEKLFLHNRSQYHRLGKAHENEIYYLGIPSDLCQKCGFMFPKKVRK